MKKLILMTSALTFVGSAAMAEITLSGKATVAYGNWGTLPGSAAVFSFNTGATLAMQQTAGDLTYGAKVSIDADAGTISDGVIWISTNFGKFSFGVDAFDELESVRAGIANVPGPIAPTADNDINGVAKKFKYGDVKYEGEFGAVSVTVVADAGMGRVPGGAPVAPAPNNNIPATAPTWVAMLGYDADGWSFGIKTDSTGYSKVDAAFDAGNFNVSGNADTNNVWKVAVGTSFSGVNAKVAYDNTGKTSVDLDGKAGDVSWAVGGDSNGGVKASVDYSMDALSIGVKYDNADASADGNPDRGDAADLIVTIGYEVSENLSFEMKANNVNEYEVSMTGGFTF